MGTVFCHLTTNILEVFGILSSLLANLACDHRTHLFVHVRSIGSELGAASLGFLLSIVHLLVEVVHRMLEVLAGVLFDLGSVGRNAGLGGLNPGIGLLVEGGES